jgi:hypothetical protein
MKTGESVRQMDRKNSGAGSYASIQSIEGVVNRIPSRLQADSILPDPVSPILLTISRRIPGVDPSHGSPQSGTGRSYHIVLTGLSRPRENT